MPQEVLREIVAVAHSKQKSSKEIHYLEISVYQVNEKKSTLALLEMVPSGALAIQCV